MIVKMSKVYVVSCAADKQALLDKLADLGAIHLTPVDPSAAVAAEKTVSEMDSLDRAMQALAEIEPAGDKPELTASDAASEVLDIQRLSAERSNRLASLHRQYAQLEAWGDVTLEQLDALGDAGLTIEFFEAASSDLGAIECGCIETIRELSEDRVMITAVNRDADAELPESVETIEIPSRDRPSLKAEAAEIDEALAADAERLGLLAHMLGDMRKARTELQGCADMTIAERGALADEQLFAIQGWIPTEKAETLSGDLSAVGLETAVQAMAPEEDDAPPTLIRYPRWAKPINALFDILGTTPGYKEMDLSPFFMIALPIFAAMLIGDGGYGLIFTLIGLLGYRKISAKAGKPAAQLLLVFGLVMLGWGMISGNYFGITPTTFEVLNPETGLKELTGAGSVMSFIGFLWRSDAKASRDLIIQISFVFGTIHLVLAHLRAAIALGKDIRTLAEIGWSIFLIGMLGIVWFLFFPKNIWMPMPVMGALLGIGALLLVCFSFPSRNPVKAVGLGLASNMLPMISAFSDTMSYIRLMAVGLASYYIALAFNNLAMDVASGGVIMWVPAGLILLFAHLLNIILGLIAVFAHGVRLNMLEFSSNAGVQWAGYPYAPFAKTRTVDAGEY
jgi:V/A-type H+/Na+-transporting ATPase subunit I